MSIDKNVFGKTKNRGMVDLYTITNSSGTTAQFTNLGAVLVSLCVADKNGKLEDIVLGFDKLEQYLDNKPCFGAVIGRYANRISGASFTLNGKTYQLDKNQDDHNIHSGFNSYLQRIWNTKTYQDDSGQVIEFSLYSPNGDQGFPGNLEVTAQYTLTENDEIVIRYFAKADEDTVVNLTNHSYFNLSGHDSGTILDHKVWIDADTYTVINRETIPTGEIVEVLGTPLDFTTAKTIGQDIDSDFEQIVIGNGYDHNWILKTKLGKTELVARVEDERSGRVMEVYTDMPGMQFYTGNFLDHIGKNDTHYKKRSGLCFETQFFPDAVNKKNFPQPILKAGDRFESTTIYKFFIS